jgi:hypothetical protein
VVAHAISDAPNAVPGTGAVATQALYAFLTRRLRMALVPTGVGMASPQVAADEGWRSGARAVVMARLLEVDFIPGEIGAGVHARLEVVVVRDGRVALRRVVETPTVFPRRATADPLYRALTGALDGLAPEIAPLIGQ